MDSNSSLDSGCEKKRKTKQSQTDAKKQKGRGNKRKDQAASSVAKRREFDKFVRWLSCQPETLPTLEWSNSTPEKIEGNEFI